MGHSEKRNWLITYDIADPRRLKRVHGYLKRYAVPVQLSAFVLQGSQRQLTEVLRGLTERIEPAADDVRAYHLPDRCEVTMLGRQSLPEGVIVAGAGLERLLRGLTRDDRRASVEMAAEDVGES